MTRIPDRLLLQALNAYHEQDRRSWIAYTPDETTRMRGALEAASPGIRGEAWDEGEEAGLDNALWQPGNEHCHIKNPYRTEETA